MRTSAKVLDEIKIMVFERKEQVGALACSFLWFDYVNIKLSLTN